LVGLPAALTSSTGMDALTHAVEAVVSKMRNPISEGLALQAIRIIQTTLPRCVETPDDLEARVAMQMAASMAGWAFSVAQTGLVHGMSHALGARCRVPHGVANGILLPHVIRFNAPAAPDKMAAVAEALGGERQGDELELATSAADAVSALLERIGHPMRLRDVNVSASELQACARLACEDLVTLTNPRPVTSEAEVVEVYNQAL
jgi:alcohol dehydrogenase class IV